MTFKYFSVPGTHPPKVNKPVVFLVEGQDDGCFMEFLLEEEEASETEVQVVSIGGVPKLNEYLLALKKSPQFTSGHIKCIGIILDSDQSFSKAEEKYSRLLEDIGWSGIRSGDIQKIEGVDIGLFLLPDSKSDGELEDLIIKALSHDPRFDKSEALLSFFEGEGMSYTKRSKRIIQIVLGLSAVPLCAAVGRGIRSHAFGVSGSDFLEIKAFITKLLKVA